MERPRALVIPFGVPDGGKGLGLGLASLVHSFARIDDGDIALAQIRSHGSDGGVTGIVEAFVTGAQWRAMPGAEDTPAHVSVILTGAFEPPRDGRGTFTVLAFDAKTGEPRAKCEAILDAEGAGRSIVTALESLCSRVGGDVSALRGLGVLGWDVLESVLLAETWRVRALSGTDPDGVLAALAHLGRAVSEARDAAFPVERLATMGLELARSTQGTRAMEAALRTLSAASEDAAESASLEASAAALCLRLGQPDNAIAHAERSIEQEPGRAFSHALVAEAKRVKGDFAGAERALDVASAIDGDDPHVANERAAWLIATGDALGARALWQKLLTAHPAHGPAFTNLATLAVEQADVGLAQTVVDHALATRASAPVDMLRRAIQVALQSEPASVARGSRLESLCRAINQREPKDAVAILLGARAIAEMGDRDAALSKLDALERDAKGSLVAAEAARIRLHVKEPLAAAAVDATIRAVSETVLADTVALEALAMRARRLGDEHDSWVAYLAAAMAERRLGRLDRARIDMHRALERAPTAPLVHVEMTFLLLGTKDNEAAVTHARRAVALDPSQARCHAVLADALLATGARDEAVVAGERARALAPKDPHVLAMLERLTPKKPTGFFERLFRR